MKSTLIGVVLVLLGVLIGRGIRPKAVLHPQLADSGTRPTAVPQPQRRDSGAGFCVEATATGDSATIVGQALAELMQFKAGRYTIGSLDTVWVQGIRMGYVVSVLPLRERGIIGAGGGGLIWVNSDTGCPLRLRLYS